MFPINIDDRTEIPQSIKSHLMFVNYDQNPHKDLSYFDIFDKPIQHVLQSFFSIFHSLFVLNLVPQGPSMYNTGKDLHVAFDLQKKHNSIKHIYSSYPFLVKQ